MKDTSHKAREHNAAALRSGSGTHQDRRTRRNRTRTSQKARAISEQRS